MKRTWSVLCVLIFISASAQAQNIIRCATDEMVQHRAATTPGYAAAVQHAFDVAKAKAATSKANKIGEGDTIFRIPVVFHIVYNTTDQNLDDSLMHSQIEVLNQDFRR